MTVIRICFVGDSVTNGTGDPHCLGWPGRLSAAEYRARGHDVSCYNLGIRAETSSMIRQRWLEECAPRLPAHVKGCVTFMFGLNDIAEQNGEQRVPLEQSLENARAILGGAQSRWPVLWLGPTPVRGDHPVINPGKQVSYRFNPDRAAALNGEFAALANKMDVPYFDSHAAFAGNAAWKAVLAQGDGVHPTAAGYEMLAESLENWASWRAWFDR